jgi:hypothetical protein
VIGLFIEEKIPRGMTLEETIAEIKRQGGLVYVPHPFDRMHSVPDYEHLLAVVEDIDALEVFNARVAIAAFNEEAVRFAAKYRIVGGAGSDAHVPQGLGSVRIRMRDFDGPEEFLESLRAADIVRKPQSLLYVQRSSSSRPRRRRRALAGPRASAACGRSRATNDAVARRRRGDGQTPRRDARHRRRDPREVPGASDPRAQRVHPRPAGLQQLPARQPDAGARLGPPAGRRLPAQVRARARRRSRRASRSTALRLGADEVAAAARHRSRWRSTGRCA